MRAAMIAFLMLVGALLAGAVTPARAAIACTVSPSAVNFGTVNVLANVAYTTTQSIAVSCSGGTAGANHRICLNLGDPNAEAGAIRKALNGANIVNYDLYTNAAYTQRFSSWVTGTGTGIDLPFTLNAAGAYSTNLTVYARVPAGQMTVRGGTPTLSYTEAFSGGNRMKFKVGTSAQACTALTTGTSNATAFTVTIAVPNMCYVTGSALSFGTTSALSANIDASTNISVTCSSALAYSIGLDNGLYGTSPATRKMGSGANRVSYMLYRDAARTLSWGATVGTNTLSGTGTGATASVPIYGRVPVQTTPPFATYTDTVGITVTY